MTLTNPPTDPAVLLAAALATAARGWHVFPVLAGGKHPALHGERSCRRIGVCRHGHRGWEQRATADPDLVRRIWTSDRFAGCNIGLACGPSGLLLLDLDLPKPTDPATVTTGCTRGGRRPTPGTPNAATTGQPASGWAVLAELAEQAGQPTPTDTRTVTTPSQGHHLYYRAPAGLRLRNTRGAHGGLGPLIDTRGHGGYVLAPGSATPRGRYQLTRDRDPNTLPDWLTRALTPKPPPTYTAAAVVPDQRLDRYAAAALRAEAQRVAQAPPRTHTSTVFTAAIALGQLVGAQLLPLGTAETTLLAAAEHLINGPCDCTEREIRRTITNGLRRGVNQPRLIRHQPKPRPA